VEGPDSSWVGVNRFDVGGTYLVRGKLQMEVWGWMRLLCGDEGRVVSCTSRVPVVQVCYLDIYESEGVSSSYTGYEQWHCCGGSGFGGRGSVRNFADAKQGKGSWTLASFMHCHYLLSCPDI